MAQCELSIGTFAEWYKDYPRHEAKLDAQKAYMKALKEGVSHERMVEGLQRFNKDIERRPRERRFIPLPASWIRAGRFDDEYEDQQTKKLSDKHVAMWLKIKADGYKVPDDVLSTLRAQGVAI